MLENLTETNCDLCGSADKIFIKEEAGFPISRCGVCDLIYVSSLPAVENGKVIGEYYAGTADEIDASRTRYEAVSSFLLDEIAALRPGGGRLLDIGCGYGFFLNKARERGWEVAGTELSHIAVNHARETLGLMDVHYTDLSTGREEFGKFDVINMTNVLEHVPSPTAILNICDELLNDDGILVVRVPNMDFHGAKERLKPLIAMVGLGRGGEMTYLATEPPGHLNGFTARTLRKYFSKQGMETLAIKPSKLSAEADRNPIFKLMEAGVKLLDAGSLHRLQLSPTILAIAAKRPK